MSNRQDAANIDGHRGQVTIVESKDGLEYSI